MNNDGYLVAIGVIEIVLSLLVFHKAAPSMIADDYPRGVPLRFLLIRAGAVIRHTSFWSLPWHLLSVIFRAIHDRKNVLKMWVLGCGIGGMGIWLVFGQSDGTGEWLLIWSNWFMIVYTSLRVHRLSASNPANWWRS